MTGRCSMIVAVLLMVSAPLAAQDRLRSLPGYDAAQRVAREAPAAVTGIVGGVAWIDTGAFEYERGGTHFRYDLSRQRATRIDGVPADDRGPERERGSAAAGPHRGRQFEATVSPDGAMKAFYKDRNVWLSTADDHDARAITIDGSVSARIKYGTASWVYGEELSQRTAMWWSPDSRKIAYYRFDERDVRDYYVAINQTHIQVGLDTEAFPTAGTTNPTVDLYIYDIATKQAVRVDVRSGHPFDEAGVGHYVYRVQWSADGRELLFLRTNRRQNVMDLAAANPATGTCRVVLREEWPTGWLVSEPRMVFLDDGTRFIWESQRNGWNNFYLYDLSGRLIAPLTASTTYEADKLVKIDETAGVLFYTARDGDSPLKVQLHRVGLDGTGDRRLTDPAVHHLVGNCIANLGERPEQPGLAGRCSISPDNAHVVDIYQTHDTPPAARLLDAADGRVLADIGSADASRLSSMGLTSAELFTFVAADGRTPLRGLLQFPSHFDPAKRYPVLVSVYGGPEFNAITARETFVAPQPLAEYGFLIVALDSRAVPGFGKRTLDAIYQKLGQTEIDDMADGIKALWSRPYVDKERVGIFGTSYGGYVSAMALLRHPEVFAAAASSSPPTDWRNYDTIYTERYMGLPQDNKAGYDAGSALTYAKDLKGRLLIYYGTADNNVHPANALQLIKALQDAGKSFDVQVGPDQGHGGVNQDRMMEFFVDALRPEGPPR
ncbi:MAG: ptpA 7 [Acidobacteria bacterium]|nr:ptpA 7 [Acidobacteriota bacterium]